MSGCRQNASVPVAVAGIGTSRAQPSSVATSSSVPTGASAGQTTSNSAQQSSPDEQQDSSQRIAQGSADVGAHWKQTPRGQAWGAEACTLDKLCRLRLVEWVPDPRAPLPNTGPVTCLQVPVWGMVVKASSSRWWRRARPGASVHLSAPCRLEACVHAHQGEM